MTRIVLCDLKFISHFLVKKFMRFRSLDIGSLKILRRGLGFPVFHLRKCHNIYLVREPYCGSKIRGQERAKEQKKKKLTQAKKEKKRGVETCQRYKFCKGVAVAISPPSRRCPLSSLSQRNLWDFLGFSGTWSDSCLFTPSP